MSARVGRIYTANEGILTQRTAMRNVSSSLQATGHVCKGRMLNSIKCNIGNDFSISYVGWFVIHFHQERKLKVKCNVQCCWIIASQSVNKFFHYYIKDVEYFILISQGWGMSKILYQKSLVMWNLVRKAYSKNHRSALLVFPLKNTLNPTSPRLR